MTNSSAGEDRPPTLAIAQRYLMETLPRRRVFKLRRFDHPAAVVEELMGSEIAFLTPDQLVPLPALSADPWLSVSSLQGLPRNQVAAQLQEADRHVNGWAYTKQWMISVNHTTVSPTSRLTIRIRHPGGVWSSDRTRCNETTSRRFSSFRDSSPMPEGKARTADKLI